MFIHTYSEYWEKGHFVAAFSNSKQTTDIKEWCYATYGRPGVRWIDNISHGQVAFSLEKDLVWFVLRWS